MMDAFLKVSVQDTDSNDLVTLLHSPIQIRVSDSEARAEGLRHIRLLQDLVDQMRVVLDLTRPKVVE